MIAFCLCITVNCPNMPLPSKPLRHTMPDDDEEVQRLVEEALGVRPCLWQIKVVRKILVLDDVITIAATGSGKSLTYWMPLLFVKHRIVVLVTPLIVQIRYPTHREFL
jgi:superfamily II DNA/RNA helicase